LATQIITFEDKEWNDNDLDHILSSLTYGTLVYPTFIEGTFSTTNVRFMVRMNTGDKIEYFRSSDQYNVTQEHYFTINENDVNLIEKEEKGLSVMADIYKDRLVGRVRR
jgi:hypothetical protein